MIAATAYFVGDTRRAENTCRDKDDEIYLSAALEGAADFIISGDKDLTSLSEFKGIPIFATKRILLSY